MSGHLHHPRSSQRGKPYNNKGGILKGCLGLSGGDMGALEMTVGAVVGGLGRWDMVGELWGWRDMG